MSVALQELCNGIVCLKCATLRGTKFCAERAQASGTTYQDFRKLTPEYEEDIKRRFATTPPNVVTQSPTTALTPSTSATPVFRVEGFPGFTNHVTAPPREVLLWSVEDSDVKQEYVVDESRGQLFKKAPIYKNLASANQDPSQSPNDLISALSSPDDNTQDESERDSLLTAFPNKSQSDSSSTCTPPSRATETSTIPDPLPSTTTKASYNNLTLHSPQVIPTGSPDPGAVEAEVAEVIGTTDVADFAEGTSISEVEGITEATVTEATTDPEVTNVTNIAGSASVTEVAESTEVTEVAEVGQFSSSSTHSPHPASNTETTSESSNSTSSTPSQTPKPIPSGEGSGFSHGDLDLDRSIQLENSTTTHTPIRPDTPDKHPNPSNTPTNGSSGGFFIRSIRCGGLSSNWSSQR